VKPRTLALLAILALAAFLRLQSLDLIDLRYDEAAAPVFAMQITQGHLLALEPFSGSALNHPPLMLYLLAVPYLLSKSILAVAAFRAVLDVAAVGACFALCLRFFDSRVAFLSSLFFAAAPWAVQFARKTWVAPLPLLTLLFIWGVMEIAQAKNPRGWAIAGWGMALAAGAHLAGFLFAPVLLALAVAFRQTLRVKPVLIGLAPLAILLVVYVGLGGALQNGLASSAAQPINPLGAINMALWGTGGSHLSDLTGPSFEQWQQVFPDVINSIDGLQVAAFVGSVVMGVSAVAQVRAGKPVIRAEFSPLAVVLSLVWIGVVALLAVARAPQMHYFTALYPIPFILMALLFDAMIGQATVRGPDGRLYRSPYFVIGCVLTAILIAAQVYTTLVFTDFSASNPTAIAPARFVLQAADKAKNGAVIAVTPGDDPAVNEQAAILQVALAGQPHRFANANAGLILSDKPAQYIFSDQTDAAYREFLQVTKPITQSFGQSQVFVFAQVDGASTGAFMPRAAHWDGGPDLIGTRVETLTETLRVGVLLRVNEPPPTGDVHWFARWLSGDQTIAQKDSGGVSVGNWRQGDLLLHWFDLPLPSSLPPKPWQIKLGSYRYPQRVGIGVLADGAWTDGVLIEIP